MFEGLSHITIAGTNYPIRCDLYVLECIQDKYGAIEKFEEGIRYRKAVDGMVPKLNEDETPVLDENGKQVMVPGKTWEYKDPDMKMLNYGLELMINEGIDVQNEESDEKMNHVTARELARKMDQNVFEISAILQSEYVRCFRVKNQQTTQRNQEENRNL